MASDVTERPAIIFRVMVILDSCSFFAFTSAAFYCPRLRLAAASGPDR
jgi:hypothetical protein